MTAELPARRATFRIRPYTDAAAGLKAVFISSRLAVREMGVLRSARTLLKVNQPGGFDCPGCAWPDPDHRSAFEYCENGAKAVAEEATTRRVGPDFFARWSLDELSTWDEHRLGKQGRLTQPMHRAPGDTHYRPISWDAAFQLIAHELNALASPHEAVFYTSGRTSNEAAFLYQLFVRNLGTNNLPDCSNMCHESSGRGLSETIGVGKGTVSLEDFDLADAILIIGQNPGTNHPRMLATLQSAALRGCRIISINPLKEAALVRFKHPQRPADLLGQGTPIADTFLQVRINGDVPLLQGVSRAILEAEAQQPGQILDHAFIQQHTEGFEPWRDAILALDWGDLTRRSGISEADIRALAQVVIHSNALIACWAMGLTQHANGVDNIREVVNLLLLRGHLGKPGAGACPVRGHSNVQGDRTMGIWERPAPAFLDRLASTFRFEPPREHGYDVVEAIEAMHAGRVGVFFAMGGNFLSAAPDTHHTAQALQRTRLTVHVATKPNRSHTVTGHQALLLPCLGRTEIDTQPGGDQLVTVEDSMSAVHTSQGNLPPASPHLLSEPRIVARLAQATLGDRSVVEWNHLADDYDRIRDLIAQTIPGFEDFNRRVRQPLGFVLPNSARERRWNTANQRARFTQHPLPQWDLAPDQLLMMTIRTHDQYNTTIYGLDDRYRGVYQQRRVILLHPDDMRDRGLSEGQPVDITSHFHGETRQVLAFLAAPYDLPRGCAATYFPEANPLVPLQHRAHTSNTPASKSIVITLAPSADLPLDP